MEIAQKRPGQCDLLHGPIFRNLLLFALPIFVSQLFQQMYNTVDTMLVGNVLGDVSLAAIGSCSSIYELMVGFALGIGNGLAIVTARSYGAGDRDLLKRSVAGSLVIGLASSLVITLVGTLGMRPLLRVLNTPDEIFEEAYSYISVISLFVLVMFAYNLCAALLRAIGNSLAPLVFLVLSACLNIGLDLWLIPIMGVRGAAVATVASQGVSVVLCLAYIALRARLLLPAAQHFAPDAALWGELAGQGFSMGFMSSIVSTGSVILQSGINGLGTLVIAGHTAARKLFSFTAMPFMAMSTATSTFVSQNRGANQPARIRKGLRQIYLYCVLCAAVLSVVILFAAEPMVRLISGSSEPVVLQNGAHYLKVATPFYAVLGVLISTRCALQGLGQKLLPLVSSCIELVGKILFVLVFIPRFQYTAVIFCEPTIWCVMTAQLLLSFYRDPYIRAAKRSEQQLSDDRQAA
jgi:putative MATE family efflux protein